MTDEGPSDLPPEAAAVTGSVKQKRCAFCGAAETLTKEHVFGDWIGQLGLDAGPVTHRAGALNRLGRDLGTGPAFARTVRSVCSSCNNGWMSALEQVAKGALTPLILGAPAGIARDQQGPLAQWAQKTAMVAMLVSSEKDRASGHGLDPSEYRALFELRDQSCPLPASTVWIGKYTGTRQAVAWVTPFTVRLDGAPVPSSPQGYAATIAVGQLVVHSARLTAPGMDLNLSIRQGMSQLWPPREAIAWPQGSVLGDEQFLNFVAGEDIRPDDPSMRLARWGPAANLPQSKLRGSMVELPAVCGTHVLYYPAVLARDAMQGRFHAFCASCECGTAYLIHIDAQAARFRAAGSAEAVAAIYDGLPGTELVITDANGVFIVKRLVG